MYRSQTQQGSFHYTLLSNQPCFCRCSNQPSYEPFSCPQKGIRAGLVRNTYVLACTKFAQDGQGGMNLSNNETSSSFHRILKSSCCLGPV